jgi:hypothetical protein
MPQHLEPRDGCSVDIQGDRPRAELPRSTAVGRIQARTLGYVARHPTLLKVLERLGWDNPGNSMNP